MLLVEVHVSGPSKRAETSTVIKKNVTSRLINNIPLKFVYKRSPVTSEFHVLEQGINFPLIELPIAHVCCIFYCYTGL